MKVHSPNIIGITEIAELELGGAGAIVSLFDTDSTLNANSNTRVATQAAVKSYVDAAVPGTGNLIFQLNSKVEVTDTGADGRVVMVADGVTFLDGNDLQQTLGVAGDTRLVLNQSTNEMDAYCGAELALDMEANRQIIGGVRAGGGEGGVRATLDVNNITADDIKISMGTTITYYQIQDVSGGEGSGTDHEWFVGGTSVANFDGSVQTIGNSGDTHVVVNQISNTVSFEGANTIMAVFHPTNGLDFYHSGVKVSETTSNGITGAVWG